MKIPGIVWFFLIGTYCGALAVFIALAVSAAKAQSGPPDGYKVKAVISACTAQGCQSQTWFLKSSRWCGKAEDGWSPTMGTGKLAVRCGR